jgi:O-antigen/teichoic acid export membrane protein
MMMIVLCTVLYTNWINKVTANLLWFALFLIPLKGLLTKQSSVLNGFRKPILALLPEIILIPLLSLLFYLLLIVLDIEFTGVLIIKIQLAVSLLVLIFCLLFITKNMSTPFKKMKPIYHFSKWHRALLPFSIMTFVATVNIELASALLGFIDDKESVGYFKVAMQGVGLITLGITVVNSVIGPNIARLYKSNDFQATQLLLTQSVKLSCACSLPIAIILMFFGDFIIILLFGEEYVAATKVLFILCVGQIVNICMGSVGLVLNMTGNEKHSLKSLMKALMLNLVLLIILVPIYQEIGAAIAVSISLICWNVLMAIDVYKITKLKTWISINNDNNKIKEFD